MEDKYKNIHNGHRIRIRERARKEGLKNFTPHQVLEYLLSFTVARKDTNPLAHMLIKEFGSFMKVFDASYDDLIKIKGLGEVSATFISTFTQMIDFYHHNIVERKSKVGNHGQAAAILAPMIAKKSKEEMIILLMDSNEHLLHQETLFIGDGESVRVSMSKIQALVMRHNAKKVIIAHNHPSGYASPSENDRALTKALYANLQFMDVLLVDHYIFIPSGDYYSFHLGGDLEKIRNETKSFLGV